MTKVVKYEIVLENCEVFEFDPEFVCVYLEGLGEDYFGHYLLPTVKHCAILIQKKATSKSELDNDWQTRIHKDITQLHITFEDGTHAEYHLDWAKDSELENPYEKDIDEKDRMVYVISATKNKLGDF